MEDTILIQNILQGDKKAEQKLYEKYRPILINYIKSKYPQNLEYEDDVSEILIKVFVSLPKYKSKKSKFKSWVFTIAKNYMIDKLRCTNKNNKYNINLSTINDNTNFQNSTTSLTFDTTTITNTNDSMEINATNTISFDNDVSVNYISSQLETCDFTFLNMHYGYGYSYCEIGNEFNISSNTVSNRVNYVKNKLKKDNINEIIY